MNTKSLPSAIKRAFGLLFMAPVLCAPASRADDIAVKTGQSIAFLGDSITQNGYNNPGGYVRLVINGLEASGIKAKAIPAGISGNTSRDMLARLEGDVLQKKPDWMTLSCGVNDVWHGVKGVELEDYKSNIAQIVGRAQATGVKVMILTSTMIHENPDDSFNQKLAAYNDYLRSLAAEKHCLLADVNADMQAALKETAAPGQTGNLLTVDGVHMNPLGNEMMAAGILKAFGVGDGQIKKDRKAWLDMPSTEVLNVKAGISARQYLALKAEAAKRKASVDDMLHLELQKSVDALLKPSP